MPAGGARMRRVLKVLPALALTVLLVAVAGASVALLLAPAALLALALLFGRYPGERVVHRLRRRSAFVRAARSVVIPRAPRSLGARLSALAVPGSGRAPPAVALI